MLPPAKIRWAVFGTGRTAARFVSDMQHSRQGRIVAIGSRSQERAHIFAAQLAPGAIGDESRNLLRRDDIDAVYLATPNARHLEQALDTIAAGKPVLVEKPFALSADEARQIAEAARHSRVLAMEAMWMRFTPGIVMMKRIADSGRIGQIRRIEVSMAFHQDYRPESPLYDPASSGALLDLGVYPLSLAVHLCGLPRSIGATVIPAPNGAIAAAGMLLGYDAAVATLSCGFDAEGPNAAVITGTHGIVRAHRTALCPPMISLRPIAPTDHLARPLPPRAHSRAQRAMAGLASLRQLASGIRTRRYPTLYRGSGLHYQADHFAECLRLGLTESPVMPLDQSIAVLDLVERAARAANASGAATTIP